MALYVYLVPGAIGIPRPTEVPPIKFGVNLYVPESMRTKSPLYIKTLWYQLPDQGLTPNGTACFVLSIFGHNTLFDRFLALGTETIYIPFPGNEATREDYLHVTADISGLIDENINSIGLVFTRSDTEFDDLYNTVYHSNGRLEVTP